MAVWVFLGLAITGIALLATAVLRFARRSRETREELRASQETLVSLQEALADLRSRIDHAEHAQQSTLEPVQSQALAPRPDSAVVITTLGAQPARTESGQGSIVLRPTVAERLASGAENGLARFLARPAEGPRLLRAAVDRGAVRVVSLGFGLVHALSPEARDRVEFASRAGMRRSRRQREQELKLARRLVRGGHVTRRAASEDR